MRRTILVIASCLLVIVTLTGIYLIFGPSFTVWRLFPSARGFRLPEILSDNSIIGSTKTDVSSRLGTPDRVEGPYSWWSLIAPIDGELSALKFHYDERLNLVRVQLFESLSSKDNPLPLKLDTYRFANPEVRHGMHQTLQILSQQGNLPKELRTIHEVEQYFPKARFVEHWYYFTWSSALVVAFDKSGKVAEVYEDW